MMNRSLPFSFLSLPLAFALFVPGFAMAQAAAPAEADPAVGQSARNWQITPSIAIDGTYTDNVNLSANNKTADFITRISPGIRLAGKSARASASLDYQWQHYAYATSSARSNQQQSLAASGRLELVEQWLFLDASHNISQQATSAFGTQGVGNELINTNRTQVSSYRLSPYIQGRLARFADYQLRYSGTHTSADTGALSGAATTTESWNGQLAGVTPLTLLSWAVNVDSMTINHASGLKNQNDRLYGTLTYLVAPSLRLSVSAGNESDNFLAGVERKKGTSGLGAEWAPTERTKVALRKDSRSFGDSFSADFTHRTALSAWRLSDSRSVRVPTADLAQGSRGTIYDLLYLQLTSAFPNPLERAAEVERQLALAGIPANAQVFGPALTSQAFIERRQTASFTLTGVNNTVTFAADRSNSQRIGTGIGLIDDLSQNQEIRQSGFNANWAYKMTPHEVLTLSALTSTSKGSNNAETTLRSISLRLTTQLGVKTSASVGLRQSHFEGTTGTGYDEQALTGAVQFKF
ncbi:MAG: TIGR03016 family PEP-CTERM system-associated outer membrane protein [Gammaproteobacteria bacterium]|nr:TIGR03016 family PEP-CTERM system-associated outer membrane protein [Rhodocyclaceae bacterium]MBU3910124.1 TIGR03016 family PEP-CTERM system-associated outer membrane protein [Gammaproteobacteria bacterium]MBU3990065.1 TIGR03016 family PEP-CTERM system-associated outer membrane protein [Gammaproteobacteria bacterium]MBU4006131.1 TIGR03016 family PEP-CTERM system-associated outer membrane protein [Gammaproteobacteria bacterium]MBU4022586.1 TIGR03016 family PEP-CTERM system-associated outer me